MRSSACDERTDEANFLITPTIVTEVSNAMVAHSGNVDKSCLINSDRKGEKEYLHSILFGRVDKVLLIGGGGSSGGGGGGGGSRRL
ncbi:hypothetical protein TYRP_005364 [Tyrophagus putrescentiae]|nr:hypothetical protein TYRP_005364 [Tyrophagus putrescentiae]